jgi:hypothetical protein
MVPKVLYGILSYVQQYTQRVAGGRQAPDGSHHHLFQNNSALPPATNFTPTLQHHTPKILSELA